MMKVTAHARLQSIDLCNIAAAGIFAAHVKIRGEQNAVPYFSVINKCLLVDMRKMRVTTDEVLFIKTN
jgi:hypothetical protein